MSVTQERPFASIQRWFWNEDAWLPPGVGWKDVQEPDFVGYPAFGDIAGALYFSVVFLLVRRLFERYVARPLAVKFTKAPVAKRRSAKDILSNGTAATSRDVDVVCVKGAPSNICKKTVIHKFSESAWRCLYYLLVQIYGLYTLWDKPWFWETAHCWYGYPFQPIDHEVRIYYMTELSFYSSLVLSQFLDVIRKDFWIMFIHHITTILLLAFSWSSNFVRIGSLVLLCHDAADFWMEASKMTRYCGWNTLCNMLFSVFLVVWLITRIGIYPFRIIYSTTIEAPALVSFFAAYYTFNSLLLVLLALQLIWTYLILRIAVNTFRSGEMNDVRSDDEEEEEKEEEEAKGAAPTKAS
uniref:TLC domain-containing protein n=1 Tax=Trichuris muris TaxID=70415 RepID=A0A5S6QMH9_TRIMR